MTRVTRVRVLMTMKVTKPVVNSLNPPAHITTISTTMITDDTTITIIGRRQLLPNGAPTDPDKVHHNTTSPLTPPPTSRLQPE